MESNNASKIPSVLIITGPTASGKTYLSEQLIKKVPSQVINADVGQFYQPLSVGTAKPDLKNISYKTHCFDICDKPVDVTVVAYRSMVIDKVNDLFNRGICPMIVGGSLFYIKSLFFPPREYDQNNIIKKTRTASSKDLWQQLFEIDPLRAQALHVNDGYRINRALDIWEQTGIIPSLYKPLFDQPFHACIVFVVPSKKILDEKIKQRTEQMIKYGGWIDEARALRGTEWEHFLTKKGLIGYPELFSWIAQGEKKETLHELIEKIQLGTVQYAKRQITFWNSFKKQLEKEASLSSRKLKIIFIHEATLQSVDQVYEAWNLFKEDKTLSEKY